MTTTGLQRLSDEDRAILDLESATIAGHTCKVLVLDPVDGSGAKLEVLRRRIAGRLQEAPRLRQRVVATPLRMAAPVWVDDPGFTLANHVLPLVGEGPIERWQLPELVATLMGGRLDRSRPLWSLHVAELTDGGAALVWRIHHSMADGTAALRIGSQVLWDAEPNPTEPTDTPPWNPPPLPDRSRLLAEGARARAHRLAHARPPVLRAPVRGGPRRVVATLRRELVLGSGPSPFDARRLSAERAVAFTSVPLSELKRIGRAYGGGTVNDILLALVAGGLRHWMTVHSRVPVSVRAKVPVSLHDHDLLGNRDSFFCIDLPVWEAQPASRVRLIHDETNLRKSARDAEALDAVFRGRSRMPIPLERFLARRADDPRVAALCVSNVPGPQSPIFVAGARVRELYSIAEIGERHALRVSAISLDGVVSLGFSAEPIAVPDLQILVEGVNRELVALQSGLAAGAPSDPQ